MAESQPAAEKGELEDHRPRDGCGEGLEGRPVRPRGAPSSAEALPPSGQRSPARVDLAARGAARGAWGGGGPSARDDRPGWQQRPWRPGGNSVHGGRAGRMQGGGSLAATAGKVGPEARPLSKGAIRAGGCVWGPGSRCEVLIQTHGQWGCDSGKPPGII